MVKRFSEIQKTSKILKRINEADELETPVSANLPVQTEEQPIVGNGSVEEGTGDIKKFISKLLESREMAQVYHWTVKGDMGSHAAHLALEAYYDGVIEHIDEIVEVYQGQYGLIEEYDVIDTAESKSKEKLDYFKEVVEFVKTERTCIDEKDTHLHNLVDEVVALLYRTIYKLTYNK